MPPCSEGVEAAETRSASARDGVEGADMIEIVEDERKRVVGSAVSENAECELSTCCS